MFEEVDKSTFESVVRLGCFAVTKNFELVKMVVWHAESFKKQKTRTAADDLGSKDESLSVIFKSGRFGKER